MPAVSRERKNEYMRAWSARNPEKSRLKSKAYREKNREKVNAKERARRAANPELFRSRDRARGRAGQYQKDNIARYGITIADYNSMLAIVPGCAICGDLPTDKPKGRLAVDHDHKTGRVRGLLCKHCNRGLGCFKDNPALLREAIEYLKGPGS